MDRDRLRPMIALRYEYENRVNGIMFWKVNKFHLTAFLGWFGKQCTHEALISNLNRVPAFSVLQTHVQI